MPGQYGNPNQAVYPYGGGTDNPSESTAYSNPGGGAGAGSLETGAPFQTGFKLSYPSTITANSQDTVLPPGFSNVPLLAAGFSASTDRGVDPEGGVDPLTGAPREAGQDEVPGATEVTTGTTPTGFPQP